MLYLCTRKQTKSGAKVKNESLELKLRTGCSSVRLEYASGGRVVAGSNPVTPTGKASKIERFSRLSLFLSALFGPA